ncbi:2'-deoxynucleoside 5'-phosphate N-hydrolase 1-like [Rana temporaria]|uniref:2'-deoxynucleoside 5'-phosphate N-hydrolase 1-like n=1 Tax=Rana temporaria TaxID=8407 RepID=UPI001AADF0DE|nr:2'-deoxynucleoside 5'-phosphate N-hydrolase 1-like [Rana temporaria]
MGCRFDRSALRDGMSLSVYFCGNIRGGREDRALYERIVQVLQRYGTVLTEHIESSEAGEDASEKGDKFIHDRDVERLKKADVVVVEVTQPTFYVGYELGRALALNKKILCLFRPSCGRELSAMIRGAHDRQLVLVKDYEAEEMEGILADYFTVTFPSL